MKKIIGLVFFIFLFQVASAIVIIPPTIYFVTLSIATFIGNAIIGLLAWVAVTGIINKKFFGKQVSEIFSHVFTGIKSIVIAGISMIIALLLINPLEIFSIVIGAVVASIICGLLLCVASYSKYRAVEKNKKTGILISNTIFSVIVLILFTLAAFTSLETRILVEAEHGVGFYAQPSTPGIIDDLLDGGMASNQGIVFPDMQKSAESSAESEVDVYDRISEGPVYDAVYDAIKEKKKLIVNEIWFQPMGLKDCIIKIGNQSFTFMPQNNCYTVKNGFPQRIMCPVKISINEVNQRGVVKITGDGSCMEDTSITIENGFLVDVR